MTKKKIIFISVIGIVVLSVINFSSLIIVSKINNTTDKEKFKMCLSAVNANYLEVTTPLCKNNSQTDCVSATLAMSYLKEQTENQISCQKLYDPSLEEKKKNINDCLENIKKINLGIDKKTEALNNNFCFKFVSFSE